MNPAASYSPPHTPNNSIKTTETIKSLIQHNLNDIDTNETTEAIIQLKDCINDICNLQLSQLYTVTDTNLPIVEIRGFI